MGETSGRCALRTNGKWYEVEYAENVFANILSRLPVKVLLECKSVSKHWRQFISSQAFADLQLLWSKEHSVYIVYPYIDMRMELYFVKDCGEIAKSFTLPYFKNFAPITIISSFNGLLCCINYSWKENSGKIIEDVNGLEIRICNPITRKALLIPKGSPSVESPCIGVAFGPKINEYKIFRFFCAKRISLARRRSRAKRRQCEVYSSSTRSWSVIGRVPYFPMCSIHSPLGSNHFFVDGTIYWFIASDEDKTIPGSILAVDIEETFGTIDLPDAVTEHSYLVELEGCLSLVVIYDDDEIVNIWSLKNRNEPKWELICSDNVPFSNDECVLFVAAKKNAIFVITPNHYYIYDLDRSFWRELSLSCVSEKKIPVAFPYTESLLSCRGHMDLHTEDI